MRKAPAVVVITAAGMLGLGASAGAGAAGPQPAAHKSSLGAVLVGGTEVPGPGDPDGYGLADVHVAGKKVCWRVTATGVADIAAAHIHAGPAGVSGPVVVPLDPYDRGCTEVPRRTARFLKQHPDQFYVNLHNAEFPAGALRGQLLD